jgi:hypothetical protein
VEGPVVNDEKVVGNCGVDDAEGNVAKVVVGRWLGGERF